MRQHITLKTIILAVLVLILIIAVYPHLTTRTVPVVLGEETFVLEVADTSSTRERGLSGRDGLATSTGMLFAFEHPGRYSFWMKDMHFPIDIMWLRDDWCVVHIMPNVSPDSYPDTFAPPVPATYVIEVGAGALSENGVTIGACLDAPVF